MSKWTVIRWLVIVGLMVVSIAGLIGYERQHTLLPAMAAIFTASIAMPLMVGVAKGLK